MLTLRALDIAGFGPYYERAHLEFVPDGITVVYGDNMVGKTSLMNAVRFAFFGEIHGRGERTRGLLSACNRDLADEGAFEFRVDLSVNFDGADYDISREATPRGVVPAADDDMVASVALRRGGTVLGPSERAAVLRAMLPKGVARFFLFDGELLDQYAELLERESESGRVISESIEQILGVPVLRDARDHLKVLMSEASRAKAAEASKHQTTQSLGVSLQQASDMKRAHEDELERERAKHDAVLAERDDIEVELRRQEVYAVAVERLDAARKDLKEARAIQHLRRAELKTAMADSWRTALDGPLLKARATANDEVKEAFARLQTALRSKAVEDGHCGTCDQDVPEGVRQHLATTLPTDGTTPTDFSGLAALARAAELDAFVRKDVRAEVRLTWDAIRAARLAEADAEGRIADANKILDGRDPDELRRRRTTLTEIGGKIEASNAAIKGHESKIGEQDEAIARISGRLAKLGTPELAVFEQRESLLSRTHAVFSSAVERYKADLRARVEQSATDVFLRMTTEKVDYKRLRINDQYGLAIIHTDGREEEGRSSGAEQVVALALMGALQANAPLSGPIVMDTPFGRLDRKHTANILSALPSMARQVILFVQEDEVDRGRVRDLLGGSLKREYELVKHTARRTTIAEAR
ncbi:MAG: AAA family ATPase [Ilumatobacteraceae bacterium]